MNVIEKEDKDENIVSNVKRINEDVGIESISIEVKRLGKTNVIRDEEDKYCKMY